MQVHLQHTLQQHSIAAKMAAFEWALSLAFDAEIASILTLQDLATIPPKNWAVLKFRFHPSLYVLPLRWNILQIWIALDKDEAMPAIAITDEPCLIWRQGLI